MSEDLNDTPPLRAISIQELSRYLNGKGSVRPCEACGNENWEFQQPGGFMSASMGLVAEDGSVRLPSPVIPTYVIACANCGATRSFLANYVLKWLKANPI